MSNQYSLYFTVEEVKSNLNYLVLFFSDEVGQPYLLLSKLSGNNAYHCGISFWEQLMLEKQDSGWNNNMLWVAMSHLGNIAIYTTFRTFLTNMNHLKLRFVHLELEDISVSVVDFLYTLNSTSMTCLDIIGR